jgi:hypothetical protein
LSWSVKANLAQNKTLPMGKTKLCPWAEEKRQQGIPVVGL